jgi:hypothetical protein
MGESGEIETSESARLRVRIFVKDCWRTFEVLTSLHEIRLFGYFLSDAREDEVVIEGISDRDRLMEKAVATVYFNTVASLPDDNLKDPFLALILWETHHLLSDSSVNGMIYCLNLLNVIAPTAFDKARLLLLSQCDPGCPDDFRRLPTGDWGVIGKAVRILRTERNRKTREARELFEKLMASKSYQSLSMAGQDDFGELSPLDVDEFEEMVA